MSTKKKDYADKLFDFMSEDSSDSTMANEALDMSLNLDPSEMESDEKTSADGKDQTIRLVHTSAGREPKSEPSPTQEAKVSYGLPAHKQIPVVSTPPIPEDVNSGLQNSEYLRIAQNKMNGLEEEISKLTRENEELASAAETFKKLNDEYFANIESLKAKVSDQKQTYSQEVELLKKISLSKDKQINELKQQIEEYKSISDNSFKRVRKREKDLEHRLEIAKIEEAAVVKSKDQLILDLKRRIDELGNESENFRKKSQENYKEMQKKQQVARSVVRALRIALTKLEGDDDSDFGIDVAPPGVGDDN